VARIPAHIIDLILQTTRIEEVIGEFVQLKRAGSNLKGKSPFTEEKTPSFMVSPAKQIFKCFSTGKGGNAVSFLMELEHFSYPEALKWLANKYGIELPEEREQTPEELEQANERDSLFIVNEFAQKHFTSRMFDHEEGRAIGLSYFIERGFREDIIRKFQLGYCIDNGSDFTETAIQKGYKQVYLEKVGLTKVKENRRFDFFRGRVMFPIHSISGRVLGFGGRTLKADKNIAKYFNSPESLIYNKSQILYGLFFAKSAIVKFDECLLVEGYTDVISMHQAGVEHVVSSSGTALTREQIKLIKRYTNHITILYDGDAAGIKASFRGIDLILEEGMHVKVVLFPDGDDPDSYSRKVSTEELQAYIKAHTQDFISFKTEILLSEGGNDPLKRAELIKNIVSSISLIPDAITRSVYMKECALLFEMEEATLIGELNKLRRGQLQKVVGQELPVEQVPQKKVQPQEAGLPDLGKDGLQRAEFGLIRVLLKMGTFAVEVPHIDEEGLPQQIETSVIELVAHEVKKDNLTFSNPLFARIFERIKEGLEQGILYGPKTFLNSEDQEVVRLMADIESSPYSLSGNWVTKHQIDTSSEEDKLERAVMAAIYDFKLMAIERSMAAIRKRIRAIDHNESFDEVTQLMQEQMRMEKARKVINNELGRIIVR
jgi:DNA primase